MKKAAPGTSRRRGGALGFLGLPATRMPAAQGDLPHWWAPLLGGLQDRLDITALDHLHGEPPPGHAPEPGLLAFGKFPDCDLEIRGHRPVGFSAGEVGADLAILQAEAFQPPWGNALGQKAPDLVDHAGLKSRFEPVGNSGAQLPAVDSDRQDADIEFEIEGLGVEDRSPFFGRSDFQTPDQAPAAGAVGSRVDLG